MIGLTLLLTGCAPPASEGDFHSSDPSAKLYAIVHAGQQKDRTAIGPLIEQLDSDDQAVRMCAINALERITGTRLGYVHYAPAEQRAVAVARWAEAFKTGRYNADAAKPAAAEVTTP